MDGYNGMQTLLSLENKPDAVFAVNDPVAFGAMRFIKEKGLRIPGNISVAGFNNDTISSLVDPPLTTVEQPSLEMGISECELLLSQIESGEEKYSSTIKTMKTSLIIHQST